MVPVMEDARIRDDAGAVTSGWLMAVGLLIFGLVFVLAARFFGGEQRTVYRIERRPPLPPAQARLCEALGTWRPIAAPEGLSPSAEQGYRLLLAGKAGEALPRLEAARREGEDWADLPLLLALALEGVGRTEAARRTLEGALVGDLAGDPDVLYRLARLEADAGMLREAHAHAAAAMRAARPWAAVHRLLARLCLKLRDHAAARRALQDVLQLEPGDAWATEMLRRMGG